MKFAVNYSRLAAELVRERKIQIDYFKCPARSDVIATAQETHPVYVHFPFKVGRGIHDAIDADTNRPVDWEKVEALLVQTDTPFVSLHLGPTAQDCPDIPTNTTNLRHIEMLTESLKQIHDGVWGQPWIVAFEYGGDSGLSGAITEATVLGRTNSTLIQISQSHNDRKY